MVNAVINFDRILAVVDDAIKPAYLTKVQELVLRQSLEGKTYSEIAAAYCYDSEYIKSVGCELWQLLSKSFGETVNKSNFGHFIRRYTTSLSPIEGGATLTVEEENGHIERTRQDWGAAPDVSNFRGRIEELVQLNRWMDDGCCQIAIISGMIGIGKTALATRFAHQVQEQFEYIVWRSLRNAPPIEETLDHLIRFLSDKPTIELPSGLNEKILLILSYLRQNRCLLILDDLQSILSSGNLTAQYLPGYEGYGQFLRSVINTNHQSFIIATSWKKPKGLTFYEEDKVRFLALGGLQKLALRDIFKNRVRISESEEKWEILLERYACNPQLLKIATSAIQKLFYGNISQFLEQKPILFEETYILLDQQFERLPILEKEILYWLVINCSPTPLDKLATDLIQSVSRAQLLEALQTLEQLMFIKSARDSYTPQFLIKEYLKLKIIEKVCKNNVFGESRIVEN